MAQIKIFVCKTHTQLLQQKAHKKKFFGTRAPKCVRVRIQSLTSMSAGAIEGEYRLVASFPSSLAPLLAAVREPRRPRGEIYCIGLDFVP